MPEVGAFIVQRLFMLVFFVVNKLHILYMMELKQTATYRKWQRKLKDHRAKALIAARIFRLANGLPGDVKSVGQGVSELRIHHGPGYRVYFQQRGNEIILLLCGGDKRSQQKDIETALQFAQEWRKS